MRGAARLIGLCVLSALLLLGFGVTADAHEVRPAFLKLHPVSNSDGASIFSALWKQPVIEGKRLKISPSFPDDCTLSVPKSEISNGTIRERLTVECSLKEGILSFKGLERTLTDIFVEINYPAPSKNGNAAPLKGEGERLSALVKPSRPYLDLSRPVPPRFGPYFLIGVDHILRGWDHLLFVICLTLMVSRAQIWGVATAFTLAHSLTLGLAAFGFISLAIRPIEILIAASIVLMAVEIMRKYNGHSSLSLRRPYLLAFFIGLIHGCGFASALSELGLPQGTELLALLMFNIGVEAGQFAVIGFLIFLFWMLSRWAARYIRTLELGIIYFSAAIAVFWVIVRTQDYFI